MNESGFKALVLRRTGESLSAAVERLGRDDLPAGEVLVNVKYSSLNYKDAMAIGDRGIIRKFPAVPGIDLAGVVEESESPEWKPGDRVVLTGWGVGERVWGGLSEYARVKAEWLVPLPEGMDARTAMALGTAGLTAMLCVQAIAANGADPAKGEVLVTGASGGVGSVAVPLLARRGYKVVALSGKPERAERLLALGAVRVVGRSEYATPSKPGRFVLEPESFQAVVDTVGGSLLASLLARLSYGGVVAACGLVGGVEVDTHVFPFIVRGVRLQGIDSVRCPTPVRREAWRKLGEELPGDMLAGFTRTISLDQAVEEAARMLEGKSDGRVVVDTAG